LGKVNKDWLVNWLVAISNKRLTPEWCDGMDCKDPAFLHELASLLLQLPLQLPIPPTIREDQAALTNLFTAHANDLNRIEHVVAHANIRATTYDKTAGDAYKLMFVEGMCIEVHHVSGASAQVPAHIPITKDFAMLSWFSDSHSMLKKAQAEYNLKVFFEGQTGPHAKVIKPGGFSKLCSEYIKAAAQQAEIDEQAVAVRPESKRRRSEALVVKAKASLDSHRQERAKRARISLV